MASMNFKDYTEEGNKSNHGNDLDLSYQNLRNLDIPALASEHNFSAAKITRLSLVGNALNTIPACIVQFENLKELDVSSNEISWVCGQLSQLTKLASFDARNNRLSRLPKEFSGISKLESLNLSGNFFREFPIEMFSLRNLRELYFGGNKVAVLPADIQNLARLEMLYLGGNQLEAVPPQLGTLQQLRHLVLCDNRLSSLPEELGQLSNLQSLSLHRNRLTVLPMGIVLLTNLQELTLRDNPLVNEFVSMLDFNPPSLLEISGRTIKTRNIEYSSKELPRCLVAYLDSARRCTNPKCDGVYFDSRVQSVKFVDFCGKFRIPLEQYLCSPHYQGVGEATSIPAEKMQKVLLPQIAS